MRYSEYNSITNFKLVNDGVLSNYERKDFFVTMPDERIISTIDEDLYDNIIEYCENNNIPYRYDYSSYVGIYLIKILEH